MTSRPRLDAEDVRIIVRLRQMGLNYEQLVAATGHCRQTIHDVLLEAGLAREYNTRQECPPSAEELDAAREADMTPTMWACRVCGYRTDNSHGHLNCQERA
jgi:hypothetical protein